MSSLMSRKINKLCPLGTLKMSNTNHMLGVLIVIPELSGVLLVQLLSKIHLIILIKWYFLI